MGYNNLQDLFENERSRKESVMNLEDVNDFDDSLECKRFPSITLGFSPRVDLFDGATYFPERTGLLADQIRKEFISSSIGAKWANSDSICETLDSVPTLQNVKSSSLAEDNPYNLNLVAESLNLETELISDHDGLCETSHSQVSSDQSVKSSLVREDFLSLSLSI